MLSSASTTQLVANGFAAFSISALEILAIFLGVGVGLLVFYFGLNAIWHADGTTNWLGRHWSWYDQKTYSPWRGYNRLRSRKWNMDHTA